MSASVVLAVPPPVFNQDQARDFTKLLTREMNCANIGWLAITVLGDDAVRNAGNALPENEAFARHVVDEMNARGKMDEAVMVLRQETHRNSRLAFGINCILQDLRLDEDETLQSFTNLYEPFLSSDVFATNLSRLMRTVCAVALGAPRNEIRGTGFLVGPDLVMTNFHVIEPFLLVDLKQNTIRQNGPGNQIYFFFDYLSAPPPDVPPQQRYHPTLCVSAGENWLLHARRRLPGDGTLKAPATVTDEYDYVVARLARPVGRLPTRRGGGNVRGWLKLPEEIETIDAQDRRIIVYQHPAGAAQQFDIGAYKKMDRTGTRVLYSVNAAKGSSGGAAVDTEGKLFALHNAEVQMAAANEPGTPPGERLNQGVRIDRIARDLAANCPDWRDEPSPEEVDPAFWSLNDNPLDPRPIIGRAVLRENVMRMVGPDGERAMVISGPAGSGLNFSVKLLRRVLGAQIPLVYFDPTALQTLSPRDFIRNLAKELALPGRLEEPAPPVPEQPDTESVYRWLRTDLPNWLRDRLHDDQVQNQARYPAWVVLNTFVVGGALRWSDGLDDLVAALCGVGDQGQDTVDIAHLRWVFITSNSASVPLRRIRICEEDLSINQNYEQDFGECFSLAWRSVQKADKFGQELCGVVFKLINNHRGNKPMLKALADSIRDAVLDTIKR